MSVRGFLFKCTDLMRRVIAPRLQYSQHLYEDELSTVLRPEMHWLDLGCGHQVLPSWRADAERELVHRCESLVGLDYVYDALKAHPSLSDRVQGDITTLPFGAESFHLVTANMVVEHLAEPERQFREILGVLAPGGTFMFHTPSVHGYANQLARLAPERSKGPLAFLLEGRRSEDVFPTHYRCNSIDEVKRLAAAAGFEEPEIRMIMSVPVASMIPPLAAVELLFIRLLMTRPFRRWRTNMIVKVRKPARRAVTPG